MRNFYRSVPGLLVAVSLLLSACAPAQATETQAPGGETQATATVQEGSAPTEAATEAATETAESTATTEATATTEGTATTAGGTETPGAGGGDAGDENTLTSVRAETAPELDGEADDDAWENASEVQIETSGGANESDTTVMVKSVYDDENVYFVFTWEDPTESFLRGPWEKQADGTWKRLSSPENRYEDENEFYEDKISLIWNINDSIQNFETQGCFTACHAGENSDKKPYGNKYTDEEGEIGDIWHWKSVRNVGQIDDQFLDHTRYSADTPGAGRKSDKNDGGGYKNNETEDKKSPAFMAPNGGDKTGAPGFISDEEKVPFDDSLFKAGDRLPSVIAAPFNGDRGNISAGWKYADGTWTLEMSRPLTTGSETDVQFEDLTKDYHFGLATFDNAQVRHAFQSGVTVFRFEQ